jgi:hypothetical protein
MRAARRRRGHRDTGADGEGLLVRRGEGLLVRRGEGLLVSRGEGLDCGHRDTGARVAQ